MKALTEAQFGYCSFMLMFQGRTKNRKINLLHKRLLQIIFIDSTSSFHESH